MNKYDIELDLTNRNSLSVLLKHIQKNSTILEFGPANGRLTRYLKNELGCRVYAVEIDEQAASNLEQYCEELIVGDIENYTWVEKFKDIKFDTIVFADVLEHLYAPEKVLVKCKEFLKEDGSVLVSLPNIAHNAIVMELLRDRFSYRQTGLLDNTHIRFFTNSSFLEIVKNCGLFCSYEGGVYAPPNETEFGYMYDDFELGNVLKKREFGEVYQFVYVLKKISVDEKISDFGAAYHREEVVGIAKLYVDTGSGFCEEQCIEIKNPHTKEFLEFIISDFENIKGLRFDPFNAMVCLELQTVSLVFDDGSRKDIVPLSHNSCYTNLDVDCFLSDDSQYVCVLDEEMQGCVKKVIVTCKYKFIGKKVIQVIENFVSLQALELSDIKNSQGWKFILFVRKLKRFFNA